MRACHNNSTTVGFILAVFLVGTLFFGMSVSAAPDASPSENIANLAAPDNPVLLSPEQANISDLSDEGVACFRHPC